MLILGLDTETNHYDPQIAKITEIGGVLWDTDLGQPLEFQSDLILETDIGTLPPEIVEITGITDGMLAKYGKDPYQAIINFKLLYDKADVIVAHNGTNFDRPLMRNFLCRYLNQEQLSAFSSKHWIDTLTDVDYPKLCSHRSMTYLQGFYKTVNPFPHRAVTDVLMMLTIIQNNFKWEDILDISYSPTLRFIAEVDYHNRDVAKDAGFKWDSARRIWFKDIKKIFVERKNIAFDFKHRIEELGV